MAVVIPNPEVGPVALRQRLATRRPPQAQTSLTGYPGTDTGTAATVGLTAAGAAGASNLSAGSSSRVTTVTLLASGSVLSNGGLVVSPVALTVAATTVPAGVLVWGLVTPAARTITISGSR